MNLDPVHIVSLNAWGGALYDNLAGWEITADADVFCFQEATRTAVSSGQQRAGDTPCPGSYGVL